MLNDSLLDVIEHGDLCDIKAFLKFGANPNELNIHGDSPILIACRRNRPDIVRCLLEAGVDANIVDINGNTPLINAIRYFCIETAKLLIDAGVDLSLTGCDKSPLHFAVLSNSCVFIDIFKNAKVDLNEIAGTGETLINRLVYDNNTKGLCFFIKSGANVNAIGKDKRTALHIAALTGHIDIMRRLIGLGANAKPRDKYKKSPMDYLQEKSPLKYRDYASRFIEEAQRLRWEKYRSEIKEYRNEFYYDYDNDDNDR